MFRFPYRPKKIELGTIRHGLMLLWFTDLMNVTEDVISFFGYIH